jgi:hypothetical protein
MLDEQEQIRSLVVRMKIEFGYESVVQLKKDFDQLSPKDKQDLVDSFNAEGKPTKL